MITVEDARMMGDALDQVSKSATVRRPGPRPKPLSVRFAEKVALGAPDVCWPWLASVGTDGYGQITISGRTLKAHRVAYQLAHGVELTAGQCVLHSCDNRRCCNPDHLRIGDRTDNAKDREERGHGNQGERNPQARLTRADVELIRSLSRFDAHSRRALARRFNTSPSNISRIVKGEAWK